jgi:hypothetical protein
MMLMDCPSEAIQKVILIWHGLRGGGADAGAKMMVRYAPDPRMPKGPHVVRAGDEAGADG